MEALPAPSASSKLQPKERSASGRCSQAQPPPGGEAEALARPRSGAAPAPRPERPPRAGRGRPRAPGPLHARRLPAPPRRDPGSSAPGPPPPGRRPRARVPFTDRPVAIPSLNSEPHPLRHRKLGDAPQSPAPRPQTPAPASPLCPRAARPGRPAPARAYSPGLYRVARGSPAGPEVAEPARKEPGWSARGRTASCSRAAASASLRSLAGPGFGAPLTLGEERIRPARPLTPIVPPAPPTGRLEPGSGLRKCGQRSEAPA